MEVLLLLKDDTSIVVEKNVDVPMRDGVRLRGDIYFPETPGVNTFPCLVQRTPYDKNEVHKKPFPPMLAASLGFAVFVQDTRGRFASEGKFEPYQNDADDGYDTIEWVAKQPWCTGKVGMYGGSYVGATQFLAATKKPPHLQAIFPVISSSLHFDGWAYHGGVFKLINLVGWTLVMIQHTAKRENIQLSDTLLEVLKGLEELHQISFSNRSNPKEVFEKTEKVEQSMQLLLRTLPLNDFPIPKKGGAYFFDRLHHNKNDAFWSKTDVSSYYGEVDIPIFHFGGWYDMFERHTVENFLGFSEGNSYQRLVMGPWSHGTYQNQIGEIDFGPDANWGDKLNDLHRKWFEYWLKGIDHGLEEEPPVQIFVMGENRWRYEQEFPLKRTQFQAWYFHSNGSANSLEGDGSLSTQLPQDEPVDTFVYNPASPVPTKGGNLLPLGINAGPRDQREIENRKDVLVYSSVPLAEDIEVTGPLIIKLWASTDVIETDFTAKLVDVHPSGYAQNIQGGVVRTSYRKSHSNPSYIEPNKVYLYEINLGYTSNLFKKGHQIRVEISSSNFPYYARNLNNGEEHHKTSIFNSANQSIYHNRNYPSHIILPIIPRANHAMN